MGCRERMAGFSNDDIVLRGRLVLGYMYLMETEPCIKTVMLKLTLFLKVVIQCRFYQCTKVDLGIY